MNNNDIATKNVIDLPVTLIVTPQTISSNEQAMEISKTSNESNNELQLALETVFLNSVLKIKLDPSVVENIKNTSNTSNTTTQNTILNQTNNETTSYQNVHANLNNNTKKIYNVIRSTNIPEHHKNPREIRILNASKIPIQYNIMATNSLYNKLPIFDQGYLGSCVANALSFVYTLLEYKQGNYLNIIPSRLFIYYNGRVIENSVQFDYGLQIYDGIYTMRTNGVCDEKLWPYVISKFSTKPSVICYQKALNGRILTLNPIAQTLIALQTAISSGFPVVFGIDVYESFESQSVDRTGIVPIPNTRIETLLGGHCIVLIAYNNANKLFTFRNSWGKGWGAAGNGYIPYAYVTNPNLAFDFFTINSISNPRII